MHASTPIILRKSRMRKRARTDLCGGRSVMVVPTATVIRRKQGSNRNRNRTLPKPILEQPAQPLILQHASSARSVFQKDLILGGAQVAGIRGEMVMLQQSRDQSEQTVV